MKNLINWKLFFILLAACVIASVLVLPYSLELTSAEIEISPVLMVVSAIVNNLLLFAIAIFLGLLFSKQTGMGLPIVQGFLNGENKSKELKSILPVSVCLGVAAGALIVLLSIPFNKAIPEFQNIEVSIPAWKALLASFYGGIAEEVLLRLFAVSLFLWVITKINKTKDGNSTVFEKWFSIVLAAVIFGLGHLPATAQITALTGIVVTRAIVLNGVAGVIFGWLYWKKGLESAIIAHFSADIVLHIITPLVVSLLMRA